MTRFSLYHFKHDDFCPFNGNQPEDAILCNISRMNRLKSLGIYGWLIGVLTPYQIIYDEAFSENSYRLLAIFLAKILHHRCLTGPLIHHIAHLKKPAQNTRSNDNVWVPLLLLWVGMFHWVMVCARWVASLVLD